MAGPVGNDGGVNFHRALRAARGPGPAAAAILAGVLLAGCGSGTPAGGTGAGRPGTARGPGPTGPGSTAASPGDGVGASSPSIINKRPATSASPGEAADSPGPGAGCPRWPAGSTSTTLLLTQASNGRQYCVQPGQGVQVYLSGELLPKAGAEPPRLTGTELVPASSGQARLLRSPADAYQAVRPGRAVLTVVRMPCQSVQSSPAPAADPDGPQAASAVELVYTGGAPVGAQCALQQALRVTIVVR